MQDIMTLEVLSVVAVNSGKPSRVRSRQPLGSLND